MDEYPKELLPRQVNPVLSNDVVAQYNFVRETEEDIYNFLDQDLQPKEIIRKIIAPQSPEREVFDFSIMLYGVYNESHIGIRPAKQFNKSWTNDMPDIFISDISFSRKNLFPLYLKAEILYQKMIEHEDANGKIIQYQLSFSHKPTCANFWHFQLFTKDSKGNYIPRKKDSSSIKRLARHIMEQFVIKAVCRKSEIIPFKFS
jgi:hypothetical protein